MPQLDINTQLSSLTSSGKEYAGKAVPHNSKSFKADESVNEDTYGASFNEKTTLQNQGEVVFEDTLSADLFLKDQLKVLEDENYKVSFNDLYKGTTNDFDLIQQEDASLLLQSDASFINEETVENLEEVGQAEHLVSNNDTSFVENDKSKEANGGFAPHSQDVSLSPKISTPQNKNAKDDLSLVSEEKNNKETTSSVLHDRTVGKVSTAKSDKNLNAIEESDVSELDEDESDEFKANVSNKDLEFKSRDQKETIQKRIVVELNKAAVSPSRNQEKIESNEKGVSHIESILAEDDDSNEDKPISVEAKKLTSSTNDSLKNASQSKEKVSVSDINTALKSTYFNTSKMDISSGVPMEQNPNGFIAAIKVEAGQVPTYTSASSASFVNQISQGIYAAKQEGITKFFIQINPPELGKVSVDLQMKGNKVKAIFSGKEQTLNLMKEESNSLKATFENMGLEVDSEFEFTVFSDAEQNTSESSQEGMKSSSSDVSGNPESEQILTNSQIKSQYLDKVHLYHDVA